MPATGRSKHRDEPRCTVFQAKRTTMQACHSRYERKPETEAWAITGMLKADEAPQHPLALFLGNARPVIAQADTHPCAVAHRDEADHCLPIVITIRNGIFQSVVDEIGQRLRQKLRRAAQRQIRRDLRIKPHAGFLDDGIIEFGDIGGDIGSIEITHQIPGIAGLEPRDHQECVEHADQIVALLDRPFQRRTQLLRRARLAQGIVGAVAADG